MSDASDQPIVTYAYDSTGNVVHKVMGNGTYTTYDFNSAGQLQYLVNYAPDDSVNSRFDYTYDKLGRLVTTTSLVDSWNYGYDAVGQLTSVVSSSGRTIEYAYAPNGNRITMADDGVTDDYSTNELDQYTNVATAVYTYDANGNVTAKVDGDPDVGICLRCRESPSQCRHSRRHMDLRIQRPW